MDTIGKAGRNTQVTSNISTAPVNKQIKTEETGARENKGTIQAEAPQGEQYIAGSDRGTEKDNLNNLGNDAKNITGDLEQNQVITSGNQQIQTEENTNISSNINPDSEIEELTDIGSKAMSITGHAPAFGTNYIMNSPTQTYSISSNSSNSSNNQSGGPAFNSNFIMNSPTQTYSIPSNQQIAQSTGESEQQGEQQIPDSTNKNVQGPAFGTNYIMNSPTQTYSITPNSGNSSNNQSGGPAFNSNFIMNSPTQTYSIPSNK
jgi:hypothetical protein